MAEHLYKIVFRGQIDSGQDIEDVKRKLAAMYKGDLAKIERKFFTGKPVVVKSNLDHQSALKMQSSLTARTGALFEVVEAVPSEPAAEKAPETPAPQAAPSPEQPPERIEPQEPEPEETHVETVSAEEVITEQKTPEAPLTEDKQPIAASVWETEEVSTFRKIAEVGIGIIIGLLIILIIYMVW